MKLLALLVLVASALFLAACLIDTPAPPASEEAAEVATATAAPVLASTSTPRLVQLGSRTFKQYGQPPLMTIDPNGQYSAAFQTNKGLFTVELFASRAPVTVNNFVFLARDDFYNGLNFHRVIENFMIQAGDPTATGGEGPGYSFQDEFAGDLAFDRAGILAMANRGPNTNGSQFFITVAPTPHLTGAHTIFGHVVSGQDIVTSISAVSTDRSDRPTEPVIIQSIDITESGGAVQ